MKKRSVEILQRVISMRPGSFSLYDLSDKYEVTLRTLQNDLKEINQFLDSIGSGALEIDDVKNINYDERCDHTVINQALHSLNSYDYKMSARERRLLILLKLTELDRFITMEQLAEECFVSRVTIKNDFKTIRNILTDFNVQFQSQSGKGIRLVGAEEALRELCIAQFGILLDDTTMNSRNIFRLLSIDYSMAEIIFLMQDYAKKEKLTFTGSVFFKISLYLFVSLNRAAFSPNLQLSKKRIPKSYLDFAGKTADFLKAALPIHPSTTEVRAFADYMETNQLSPSYGPGDDIDLYQVIGLFLKKVGEELDTELRLDDVLMDSLLTHIRTMNKGDLDDSFATIKIDNFPAEFKTIRAAVKEYETILEQHLGYKLTSNMEMSIALHINAAILRLAAYFRPMNILVACPGSMATGKFLEAQLKNYFDFNVMDVVAASKVSTILNNYSEPVDMVISTVHISDTPVLSSVVHPLLTMDDLMEIQAKAHEIKKQANTAKTMSKHEVFKKLEKKFSAADSLELKEFYLAANHLIDDYLARRRDVGKHVEELLDLDDIQRVTSLAGWQDGMKLAGHMLLKKHIIDAPYIDAMISNVLDYGPYIVISPGIALAHASKEFGVHTDGISLVVTEEPVFFEEVPVHLIFCIALDHEDKYLSLIKEIIRLGQTPDHMKAILNCQTNESIIRYIAEVGKQ